MSAARRTSVASLVASAALMLEACAASMPLASKNEHPDKAPVRLAESTKPANAIGACMRC